MSKPECCEAPVWSSEHDLGSARGFEFLLGKCKNCGRHSMNVFCVTMSTTGYEPVTDEDAAVMRAVASGKEMKALMRAWADSHL